MKRRREFLACDHCGHEIDYSMAEWADLCWDCHALFQRSVRLLTIGLGMAALVAGHGIHTRALAALFTTEIARDDLEYPAWAKRK